VKWRSGILFPILATLSVVAPTVKGQTPHNLDRLDFSTISSRPVRVEIDGVEVKFGRGISKPRIIGSRAYARVCSLSDALHVKMWNHSTLINPREPAHVEFITLDSDALSVSMPIDSHSITVNKAGAEVADPAREING